MNIILQFLLDIFYQFDLHYLVVLDITGASYSWIFSLNVLSFSLAIINSLTKDRNLWFSKKSIIN